ncbi:MAG: ATP-dependent helicase HrpB [Bacteroidales bacterium]|nr:ATP-dependent helicase HrpB [Bacteroidales bacterium]
MAPPLHRDLPQLPALQIAGALEQALSERGAAVVCAPPGAGKSTLLPLTLLASETTSAKILMLEPRRIAARQIAHRMAELLGEQPGDTVGYRMRFESRVSQKTRIEVVTEGILTRMLTEDPGLEGVSTVLFDEIHERSLTTDVALALTRASKALLRPDLRIALMSATLDAEALCQALDAPLVSCEGRCFRVELHYTPADPRPEAVEEEVAKTIRQAHAATEGDILAFLPGEAAIRRCADQLGRLPGNTQVMPLYGMLPFKEQQAAVAPSTQGTRKIVLATPVAETTLTIEGVRTVIDSGFCRRPVFDEKNALSRLETMRISADMADQRSGRAGRTQSGICYRLWSRATQERMAPTRTPEILEADLSGTVLEIAAWGESQPEKLPWLTPPPPERIAAAKTLLAALGAIDAKGNITRHGRAMAALPCHPRIANMILRAKTPENKALATDIAAILEDRDPLAESSECGIDLRIRGLRRARQNGESGKWANALRSAQQYRRLCGAKEENGPVDPFECGMLLCAAYPERIGKRQEGAHGQFLLASEGLARVDGADPPSSADWLVAASINAVKGGAGRVFLAAPVAEEDLRELAVQRDNISWGRSGLIARREWRIGKLLLCERPLSDVPRERALELLCEAARKDGRSLFDWNDEVAALQRRMSTLAAWHPELGLPNVDTETLLESAEQWLPAVAPASLSAQALKKTDLCQAILGLLDYKQLQALEKFAPTRISLPGGKSAKLEYRQGAEAPILRIRLEDCFGLLDTPTVDGGKRKVLMELLSPGYKPVQLTSDLRSFWSSTYFEVRAELRRRYPKHPWPEDPIRKI